MPMFTAVRTTAAEDRRFLFIVFFLFLNSVLGGFESLQAVKHTSLFIC